MEIFTDFQCMFCKIEANSIRTEVLPSEADVGMRFRHLPLPKHQWARLAAEAVACVGAQDNEAFWQVHDLLFLHQDDISNTVDPKATIDRIIESAGCVDMKRYAICQNRGVGAAIVSRDLDLAKTTWNSINSDANDQR